jgi:hypothetical protein
METIQDQQRASLFFCANYNGGQENSQDIKIVISQAQLGSGLTEPILEDTKTWTPYIKEGLIRHIRDIDLHTLMAALPSKMHGVRSHNVMVMYLSCRPSADCPELQKVN